MRRFAKLRRRGAPACENRAHRRRRHDRLNRIACALFALAWAAPAAAADAAAAPWWIWPLALFAVSFAIGIVGVLAGVGGGVLFVPIVGGFVPFHLEFVRAAGLPPAIIRNLACSGSRSVCERAMTR